VFELSYINKKFLLSSYFSSSGLLSPSINIKTCKPVILPVVCVCVCVCVKLSHIRVETEAGSV
jgi:hypothetical protein